MFVFDKGHDAARCETIGEGTQHSLGFGLVHQHQPAHNRVERPVRRGGNVRRLESDVRQPKVFHAAVCGIDLTGVAVDAKNLTRRAH